ncbi:MAG: glycosyltransferase family 9 protein [Candidatus Omnitrophica bacterium]|nr:glycosyltransferase family 9 protein [Candidatus Omnitrophota bacterium]
MNLDKISNILAIRTDRFGEFILTLPAIHALKESFPNSSITLMAHPYSRQLVQGSPDIDQIIEYQDPYSRGLLRTFRLINELKRRRFDLAVIFNPKKKFNIVTFLAGIPNRLGYDRKWGFLLNKKVKDFKFLGAKHEVEYNFDLIESLAVQKQKKVFPISIDKDDQDFLDNILKGLGVNNGSSLVIVHPWTSDVTKQWPLASFINLVKRLIKELNLQVILIGGKEEEASAESFSQEVGSGIINLTGKLSLRHLASLFKRSKCLISNDSGPVHLAAAVDTLVIALFRSDIPGKSSRRWGPYGKGHMVIEKPRLEEIDVQDVLEKVKILIMH